MDWSLVAMLRASHVPDRRDRCARRIRWLAACLLVAIGARASAHSTINSSDVSTSTNLRRMPSCPALSPDLALYRQVIADVRGGRDYYAAAHDGLLRHEFPVASPLNWRLPTYAWLSAFVPSDVWIQCLLVGLALAGIALAWRASREVFGSNWISLVVVALSCGVACWSVTGAAFYAQESWAGILLLLSLSAYLLGGRWRVLALVAGLAALGWRELALPYCAIACALATWHGRWPEASGWLLGILGFFGFYAWHVIHVQHELGIANQQVSTQVHQWLTCGGVPFLIRSARMNGLLFTLPDPLLAAYVTVAIIGWPLSQLLAWRATTKSCPGNYLAVGSAGCYAVLFCCFGRPENFYWGLISAPCLVWGFAAALDSLLSSNTIKEKTEINTMNVVPTDGCNRKMA